MLSFSEHDFQEKETLHLYSQHVRLPPSYQYILKVSKKLHGTVHLICLNLYSYLCAIDIVIALYQINGKLFVVQYCSLLGRNILCVEYNAVRTKEKILW